MDANTMEQAFAGKVDSMGLPMMEYWAPKDDIFFFVSIDQIERVVEKLDVPGADVDAADADGLTALHWACDRGHAAIVALLVDRGAALDAADGEGQTALHYALTVENWAMAAMLVARGASVAAKLLDGTNPMDDLAPRHRQVVLGELPLSSLGDGEGWAGEGGGVEARAAAGRGGGGKARVAPAPSSSSEESSESEYDSSEDEGEDDDESGGEDAAEKGEGAGAGAGGAGRAGSAGSADSAGDGNAAAAKVTSLVPDGFVMNTEAADPADVEGGAVGWEGCEG